MKTKTNVKRACAAVALLSLGLAGIAITVTPSDGQEPLNPSYLPNLDMGPRWRTTLELINLNDRQIGLALNAADIQLASRSVRSMEISQTVHIESRADYLAAATFQSLDGKRIEVIPAIRDTSKQLLFPMLFSGDHNFKKLAVLNVESKPAK